MGAGLHLLHELLGLLRQARAHGRLQTAPRHACVDVAPELAEQRGVRDAPGVVGREPDAVQEAPLPPFGLRRRLRGLLSSLVELPGAAAMIDLVVVQEVELAGALQEPVAHLHADLLDQVEGLHLLGAQPARRGQQLGVLRVAGRELRGELAVAQRPDREVREAVAALPDAREGLEEAAGKLRVALEHDVVDLRGAADARVAARGGGADAQERDAVAPVRVQAEVVVGLPALRGGRPLHLRADLAHGQAEAPGLAPQARAALRHPLAQVGAEAQVGRGDLDAGEALDGEVVDHDDAGAVLEVLGPLVELYDELRVLEPEVVGGDVLREAVRGVLDAPRGESLLRRAHDVPALLLLELDHPVLVVDQLLPGPDGRARQGRELRGLPVALVHVPHRRAGAGGPGPGGALRKLRGDRPDATRQQAAGAVRAAERGADGRRRARTDHLGGGAGEGRAPGTQEGPWPPGEKRS
mmetsp:Transcript_96755/g.282883  ORF Transcript_96755/g.282883 Transcript_96755/m.282883 type:complete len:468 (+) Transcript_96755:141-1544(+)